MRVLGKVVSVSGNMVSASFSEAVRMNEVAYIQAGEAKLKAEVIRIFKDSCDMQVFESTVGVMVGNEVEFSSAMLSIELGPGLLGGIYDGLGNPLPKLAEKSGFYLKRGLYLDTLDQSKKWNFEPVAKIGDRLRAGHTIGTVAEGQFQHRIMVPFDIQGSAEITELKAKGSYQVSDSIASLSFGESKKVRQVFLRQYWPVKKPIECNQERLAPRKPLSTRVRIVDTFFPVAEGGTACIPGPFGSGKTVFQQSVSKFCNADIVIVAACGERAGEVVETLREFPELKDPRTGRSLMERTIIICNTSSMPVAAREASVYTAMTIAEYYRQMGLSVLVLADSTSRWAQALREMSGRLEEIPGEEAFPAYLGSLIAGFYERAGSIRLQDPNLGESHGAVTLIGSVSPAGGNFEEPVTQSTLAVVGCFLGLTYARSYAKRFPAISPADSWSKYLTLMQENLEAIYGASWIPLVKKTLSYYLKGQEIGDQMKVVGEEDLSQSEFEHYLFSEFIDSVFLQQNAFDEVDASPEPERTRDLLLLVNDIVDHPFSFKDKETARQTILELTTHCKDLNISKEGSSTYKETLEKIMVYLAQKEGATEAISSSIEAIS